MSDGTTPATTPASAAAPAAPAVDAAAIAREAASEATKAAAQLFKEQSANIAKATREEIARSISGEKPKPKEQELLETFAKDPAQVLHRLKEMTKDELRNEERQRNEIRETQRSIVAPFVEEYPQLTGKKLSFVEKIAEQYEAQGVPYSEALKKGCEEAVKEFGLESVTEAQKKAGYRAVGLPGGGGMSMGAPAFDEKKSESDFLSGMKARHSAIRTRKAG